MEFLYWLESIRNPVLDSFFSIITHLGSELLFMVIAIVVFWCVSKKNGYYLLTVGFFGTMISQFLKLVCHVPRPWVQDPNFTIVESARADATGYSFPSGHTQSVSGTLGSVARFSKGTALRIVCIVLILLTGLSRMYLGVHSPMDVGVGLLIGLGLALLLYPLFDKTDKQPQLMYIIISTLIALSLAYVIFVETHLWPDDFDAENLASGIKNGYLMAGCGLAMLLSYYIDQKHIRFDVKAPWWAQILKVVLGLALVIAIKTFLKPVLNTIFSQNLNIGNAIRYFLMVVFAAAVWPLTFGWFAKGCPMGKRARKVLKIVLIIILVLILLAALLFWVVTRDTKAAPIETDNASNPFITPLGTAMLSGHRAGGGIAPENTMMALKNCVESTQYRLDVFEFDLHLTGDGVLVLLHDSTLDRTSNAAELFGEENVDVGSKTFAQLKELNMGEKFEADDSSAPFSGLRGDDIPEDLRIISLEEALEYLENSGNYRYIIEIKNSGEKGFEAADKLYATLSEFDCLDRAIVGTFHNEVTEYMDSTYPDMLRSAGMDECLKFYIYSLLNLKTDDDTFRFVALQIPTEYDFINLGTSRLVNYAHKNNIAVQYWTINDPDEVARLQSIGADAIMSDLPDMAALMLTQP